MDWDKPAVKRVPLRTLLLEGFVLSGALCLVAFCFAGPSTKGMIIAILSGTVYGQAGEPAHAAAPVYPSARVEAPPLRLLGHGCREEYGDQLCEGEVRNTSGERLQNVMVEVLFQDATGGFIKAEEALITYQPLMPGQTSPFRVITTHNPLIRHYRIRFKQMFGGELKASR